MKIGIDARFLTHPQVGGFKTYTVNLIKGLSQVDSDNHYILYIDRTPTEVTLPDSEKFTYRVVPASLPVIGMPVREQILLGRQIARDKLDIVHFLCNTAPIMRREKYIVTLHDTIQVMNSHTFNLGRSTTNYKQWAITAYSKWAILNTIRFAKKIITVSNFEKKHIVKHLNIKPQRIWVTHLAPNPVFIQGSAEDKKTWRDEMCKKFNLGEKYIMGIGSEPRKNIPLLILAFSKIASAHPDLRLVIVVAEQKHKYNLQQLVNERNLNNRITILGALAPRELLILYNLAELFVFPSERESFGLPPLEAMACGTPTIAMNITSLPEILEDGAVLINGKDVQTWANVFKRVLTDDELRSDLVCRGLKQAAKLSWQRCALETLHIYRKVFEEE